MMKSTWLLVLLSIWLMGIAIYGVFFVSDNRVDVTYPDQVVQSGSTTHRALEPAALQQVFERSSEQQAAYEVLLSTLPASLADVPRPSLLNIDSNGELIVDIQLRNLFEYYLSALGEEPLELVLIRIRHALSEQLTADALAKGEALLEAYIQFRNQQGVIRNDYEQLYAADGFNLQAILAMKHAERQARQLYFTDAQSEALFGPEDMSEDALIARLAVLQDDSLSQEARDEKLQSIDLHSQVGIEAERNRVLQSTLAQDALLMGQSEDAYRARVDAFGDDVAQRLQARDAERAQWRAKVAAYRLDLQPLMVSKPIDPQLLFDLRRYHFTGAEQVRIAALDSIELGL